MNIIKKNDYKCIANKINTQKKLLEDKNKKQPIINKSNKSNKSYKIYEDYIDYNNNYDEEY